MTTTEKTIEIAAVLDTPVVQMAANSIGAVAVNCPVYSSCEYSCSSAQDCAGNNTELRAPTDTAFGSAPSAVPEYL
jgi:hypothetical protein